MIKKNDKLSFLEIKQQEGKKKRRRDKHREKKESDTIEVEDGGRWRRISIRLRMMMEKRSC